MASLIAFDAQAVPKEHQIQVRLFGNLCLLKGPLEENALKELHSVSPEQLPPPQTLEQAKSLSQKLQSASNLPTSLVEYRDHFKKRMLAWVGFYEVITAFKQDPQSDVLWIAAKKFITPDRYPSFESTAKAMIPKDKTSLSSAQVDQIKDTFDRYIEADPQEDFHRIIRKLNVQYACNFEESEE